MLTPASKYRKGCTTCVFISREKCLEFFFISEAAGGSEWTFCSSHKHTLSCTWKCLSACLMFWELLVWQEAALAGDTPWATISWRDNPQNLLLGNAGDGQTQKNPPISPGAAVLVLLRHTIPRLNHCQKHQGIMRSWWSLQKALTALQVMQPWQGHAKKSILQRILPSLLSAARRLEFVLCSAM